MKQERINYTQVVWTITRLLQDAESLEDALRTSLGEVVRAVGAEAGTIWFYNSNGDKRIYPSFWIGGADLTGLSLAAGEGIAGMVVQKGKTTVVKDCQKDDFFVQPEMIGHHRGRNLPLIHAEGHEGFVAWFEDFILFQRPTQEIHSGYLLSFKSPILYAHHTGLLPGLYQTGAFDGGIIHLCHNTCRSF